MPLPENPPSSSSMTSDEHQINENHAWTSVTPHRYARPLSAAERVLARNARSSAARHDGKQEGTHCSWLRLSGDEGTMDQTLATLKAAWVRLRRELPIIASTVEVEVDDGEGKSEGDEWRMVYEVPERGFRRASVSSSPDMGARTDPADPGMQQVPIRDEQRQQQTVDLWVDSTFVILPDVPSMHEVYSALPPCPVAKLHWLPRSQEVLLRLPAWMTDGRGVLSVWHALMQLMQVSEAVDKLPWGQEIGRLSSLRGPAERTPISKREETRMVEEPTNPDEQAATAARSSYFTTALSPTETAQFTVACGQRGSDMAATIKDLLQDLSPASYRHVHLGRIEEQLKALYGPWTVQDFFYVVEVFDPACQWLAWEWQRQLYYVHCCNGDSASVEEGQRTAEALGQLMLSL